MAKCKKAFTWVSWYMHALLRTFQWVIIQSKVSKKKKTPVSLETRKNDSLDIDIHINKSEPQKENELIFRVHPPPSGAHHPIGITIQKDHHNCSNILDEFLLLSSLSDSVCPAFTTQSSKALHSIKAMYAPKNKKILGSFDLRMCLKVFHKNKLFIYFYDILKNFHCESLDDKSSKVASKICINFRQNQAQKSKFKIYQYEKCAKISCTQ